MKLNKRQELAVVELLAAFGFKELPLNEEPDERPHAYSQRQLADYLLGTSLPMTTAMQLFGIIGDPKVIEAEIADRVTRHADDIWRCAHAADSNSV
jgi:hypothetical protein